ncbi:TPA: hypothetical protein I7712_21120 [Vibrio vulnificus]|uniref:hypothetical protein n=1 Tax=Vibrio vulnificus TaxID=672 RepID=UPI00102CB112|nr:hypothetical protein [Vibrio vulnificus]EGQ7831159.1 hypothetical protein [Vibrio vulnificus]EGQ7949931.1 hypothetical protein [Vibrio vulnificus]EGR0750605.1 hypothetical protein [Vibrio vulnificus]EHH2475157.1 hypothetical protein [Vibrio vulnificus]EHK8997498.1 hypothetical protein [Vibrio vulnificus]
MDQPSSVAVIGYLLYDFAPFLSVAMAVNFVSSFWDGIKKKAINDLDANANELISELNGIYTSGDCGNSGSVKKIQALSDKYKKVLSFLSALSTFFGVVIVIAIFLLLILIGFSPKHLLSFQEATFMISLSLFPSTLLRLIGIWYSKSRIEALKEHCETIKQSAKDALKDNEQSAYQ